MSMHVDRIFTLREVPAHRLLAAFLEGERPGRHAMVEQRPWLGFGEAADAVTRALRAVLHHFVLIARDQFVFDPDRRADRAVLLDRLPGPVAAGLLQVMPARKTHGDDLV